MEKSDALEVLKELFKSDASMIDRGYFFRKIWGCEEIELCLVGTFNTNAQKALNNIVNKHGLKLKEENRTVVIYKPTITPEQF